MTLIYKPNIIETILIDGTQVTRDTQLVIRLKKRNIVVPVFENKPTLTHNKSFCCLSYFRVIILFTNIRVHWEFFFLDTVRGKMSTPLTQKPYR